MKKYLIFSILSLIFLYSFPMMAVKKIEANPINVAIMLVQEKDSASMASTCEYYGYERQPQSNGYTIFKHFNRSQICYKYSDSNQAFPTVEVTSKASAKEKDQILQKLNFRKVDNSYEQKSVGTLIKCSYGPHGSLILTRHSKPKEKP